MKLKGAIDCLREGGIPSDSELTELLHVSDCCEAEEYLFKSAREVRDKIYGPTVFARGLIEASGYCKNDCLYCGLRRSNGKAERYRLTKDDIMTSVCAGYGMGFRTFVLQGGEDGYFTDEVLSDIISSIKDRYSDCAVTLSFGERSRESYRRLREAGADRYLLRHETATPEHYARLHPKEMSFGNRIKCLENLKELGYQVGCGFMVGSPYQTDEDVLRDLRFIRNFKPHMAGIGPFIPHGDTPFKSFHAGCVGLTVRCLAIVRLMVPDILLPATTALATLSDEGRVRGFLAGANVVMPNLSPEEARGKYSLYDGKKNTGAESAEGLAILESEALSAGCRLSMSRGDHADMRKY